MIFQKTEKQNIKLDASSEVIKWHCEALCADSSFELNHFELGNKYHFSIEHRDNVKTMGYPARFSIRMPHLKAVIKKAEQDVNAEVEFTYSYAEMAGLGLLVLTMLMLAIVYYNRMDSSWFTFICLIVPTYALYSYLHFNKLKNEKTELRKIVSDLEKAVRL